MQVSTPRRWPPDSPAWTACCAIAATAWAACPDRMLIAWVATHASAWGSPSAWKHQAAFHKYSRTWTGVDEDVDPHAAAGRFSAGQVQLVAGTVDQHHPGAPVGRIPLLRLVEDRLDDLLAVGGDRAGQPLGLRVGTEPAAALAAAALGSGGGDTDDVVGAAGGRFGVVDHSQGGHPFASLLFAAGQPGAIRPRPFRLGCLQGRLAQRSGRTTTPLPSTDTTSTVASVDGWGVMAWENASMSAAAATVSSSTCRLPTTCPQRRPIASVAWSNEPRTASRAASRCSPWLWRSLGSRRAASAG